MRVLVRVLGYMRRYWVVELLAYLAMVGINGVRLLQPELTRTVIDDGISAGNTGILLTAVITLFAATLLQGFLRFVEGYLSERVSQGVAYNMRNEVYRKLQGLSFSYHDTAQNGQLLSRSTSDVERLRRFTGRGLLGIADAFVLLIGTTVMLVRMNLLLAGLSLVVIPIVFLYMQRYMRRMHPQWHRRQDETAVLTSRLEQNLRGMSVVRGFAQEPAEIDRFEKQNSLVYDISMWIANASAFATPFIVFLASIGTVAILWLGGRLVSQGLLTVGELVAFNSYLLQLINPIRRMGMLFTMVGESKTSAERVFEILDARSEVTDRPDAQVLGKLEGRVAFDGVSFSYIGGRQVLSDVSFKVEPGQVVALLGPTGSGKSTVINLIPRFYDVSHGRVLVDGIDVRDVLIESLRNQVGIVLQETTLFGATIRENIAFGRPDASLEEIEASARAAAAHDFIMEMSSGYDTEVGERGVTLSGGQRQRVAIARALLMDPSILLLDDATSSVDTETEQRIQQALGHLMRGRTSFVIAQRVSTVRNADLILVIDQGRLIAQGQHEDLIRESGIYADIYYRQLVPEKREPIALSAGREA